MVTYEYEILHLRQLQERDYHWESTLQGLIGHHDKLHPFLNDRGQEGWTIATHVSDGRFGNMIVLQRLANDSSEPDTIPTTAEPTVVRDTGSESIVRELADLRTDLLQSLALQSQILSSLGQQFPTVLQAISHSMTEIAGWQSPAPVQATVDAVALRQLGGQLETAIDGLRQALQPPAPTPVKPPEIPVTAQPQSLKMGQFWKHWRWAVSPGTN